MEHPRVGIVILNWNNGDATSRCLRSLVGITYPDHAIYLVDNASTDGSAEELRTRWEGGLVTFIHNEENLGFAAGCNRGIRRAVRDGCDYILLLNNDCVVCDEGFLEEGVAIGEKVQECGLIGGKILDWSNPRMIWSTGGRLSFWGGERHIGHNTVDRGQFDKVAKREFVSGALMLIKRTVITRVGLLPEAYFFGKEEWEYSVMARRAGFTLLYNPAFRILHEPSNSHDWSDPTYVYNGTLSKILFKRRVFPRTLFLLWRLAFGAYVKYLFPIKYRLLRGSYLTEVGEREIRRAMRIALSDSKRVEKVTRGMLDKFRASAS